MYGGAIEATEGMHLLCVDKQDIRKTLLMNEHLKIHSVPSIILTYPHGATEKFEGSGVLNWIENTFAKPPPNEQSQQPQVNTQTQQPPLVNTQTQPPIVQQPPLVNTQTQPPIVQQPQVNTQIQPISVQQEVQTQPNTQLQSLQEHPEHIPFGVGLSDTTIQPKPKKPSIAEIAAEMASQRDSEMLQQKR
jgi:hypothetical protein